MKSSDVLGHFLWGSLFTYSWSFLLTVELLCLKKVLLRRTFPAHLLIWGIVDPRFGAGLPVAVPHILWFGLVCLGGFHSKQTSQK